MKLNEIVQDSVKKEIYGILAVNNIVDGITITKDGKVDVVGSVNVTKGMIENGKLMVPFNRVNGSFIMNHLYEIESLEGCPEWVGGNFNISHCKQLTSLVGGPKELTGSYDFGDTGVTSLDGIATYIGGHLSGINSKITSLKGISDKIRFISEYLDLNWRAIDEGGMGLVLIGGKFQIGRFVNTTRPFQIIKGFWASQMKFSNVKMLY